MGKKFSLAEYVKDDMSKMDTGMEQITLLPLEKLIPDERNFYSLDGIDELAANIETAGLLDPIRVRPQDGEYVIVSGHRRRAACMLIRDGGNPMFDRGVPCIIELGEASDAMRELRLIFANSATRQLTSAELSKQAERTNAVLLQLKKEGFEFKGKTRELVAEILHVSESKVARVSAIRKNLCEPMLGMFDKGRLNESVAYRISQEPPETQARIWKDQGDVLHNLTADGISAYLAHVRFLDSQKDAAAEDRAVEDAGFDVAITGFDPAGLVLGEEEYEDAPVIREDDSDEEPPEEPRTKRGQIWQLGEHRLMCGDATSAEDVDTLLSGEFVRLTVTSPPYGVGKDYEKKGIDGCVKTMAGAIEAIKGKSLIIAWNVADLSSTGSQFTEPTGLYSVQLMKDAGYGLLYTRIWKKPGGNFAGNNPYYTVTTKPVQDYEYLFGFALTESDHLTRPLRDYLFHCADIASISDDLILSLGGPAFMKGHWFTDRQWAFIDEKNYTRLQKYCRDKGINAFQRDYTDLRREYLENTVFSHCLTSADFSDWGMYGVWQFSTVHERLGGHAAAFPVELPARYIKMHSYPGSLVFDCFGGTGTTMIACEQLGRRCRMMEIDPHYCDVIIGRWESFTGKKAVLLNG